MSDVSVRFVHLLSGEFTFLQSWGGGPGVEVLRLNCVYKSSVMQGV